ncbi:MAG: tRNA (adenosine(37)-N6)-dimethylallyltransferase MiaA [Campylobacterales bacterium]|nr:tRNA (adenosine(37)-N6)-dimethylallyltransferase MiaA [Campylobacterales bacterium]
MKQLAIIGPTASGKSDLALALAVEHNALILSIDSLSIYREINIASAKPSPEELLTIDHFGINTLAPNENANVFTFINEYHRAQSIATQHGKNLIIVGGSSFYLKSMIEGLSTLPEISKEVRSQTALMLHDLGEAHHFLSEIDPLTMSKITPSDTYRIEKMLHLTLQTSTPPSQWFHDHPPQPIIHNCPILSIDIDRSILRERIRLRTQKMVSQGIIDEVAELERLYGRAPNSMKAIGIIETLEFLDGKITKQKLLEEISTHTSQLAKRQQTFNNNQFVLHTRGGVKELTTIAITILRHP